jgi:hypothetical protein
MRVLIVEDEPIIVIHLELLVAELGHEVCATVVSAVDAIERAALPSLCGSLTTRGSDIGPKSHSTSSRERPVRIRSPRPRPR